jgi:Mg2+/Co2+ transporter CorC
VFSPKCEPNLADDWPTFGQELSRKAIEALEKIVEKYENGQAKKAEALAVVDALYGTISGLVTWDVVDLIVGIGKQIESGEGTD